MYYVVLDAAWDSQDPTQVLGIFQDDEPLAKQVRDDHEARFKQEYGDNWWSRAFVVLEVPELGVIYPLDYKQSRPWGI